MFRCNQTKTFILISLVGFAAVASHAAACQAQVPSPLDRGAEVVGDCLAILFVDPQQPESGPMDDMAAQAIQSGWAFRRVDLRKEMHVAQRWRIHTAPTVVLVRGGREVDRILGGVAWPELSRRMLKFSSPDSIKAAEVVPSLRDSSTPKIDVERLVPMQQRPTAATKSIPNAMDPQAATVRIVVDEPNSHAVGSGTIVHSAAQGAIVLTCGHLFRDWTRESVITVERFQQGVPVKYPAELLDFQIDDVDIGVLLIKPGRLVPSAKVAQQADGVREGDSVFSVGCDHGDVPSRRDSRVTKLNRYLGSPNIETDGLPVQGRSGGGLFNGQGELIGICFAADAELNEGLYCGTQSVLEQLRKIGLLPGANVPASGQSQALAAVAPSAPKASEPAIASTMTVILTDSSGSTRQLTFDQPSEQLLDAMRQESQRTRHASATSQVRWKVNSSPETK